ncbi:hypothetical protein KRP22_001987 [Phytophthora ramorum]|nr:Protein sel-1-like protein 2 [Phytophthora ramorum]
MRKCRLLIDLLGFLVASLTLTESRPLTQDVQWFSLSPASEREAWKPVESTTLCALDAFRFGVNFPAFTTRVPYKNQDGFEWQLIANRVEGWENGAVVAAGALQVKMLDYEEEQGEIAADEEGLECEFDPEFCIPKLVGIQLPDVVGRDEDGESLHKGHTVELAFEKPTNRPRASSKAEIDEFVVFTEYIGDELVGSWSDDGLVLVIQIIDIDEDTVKPVRELMQGLLQTSIYITNAGKGEFGGVDRKLGLHEGMQSLRIEPPGTYTIGVSAPGEEVIWSPELSVQSCDSSYLVVDPRRASADASNVMGSVDETIRDTATSFAIDGILTHGGEEGFVLTHDAIQMETAGSWSLSFWVFLTEDSTGSFRTLFFNGDGEHQQRTPSAWWKPDERRLVLRLSTNTNADVGLDSNEELPLNHWTHLGFTFANCSESAITGDVDIPSACPQKDITEEESWLYSFAFYVNGLLDTEVRVYEPVVANSGPLHIGKGPWTDGMHGFTSNLRVFSVPISPEEHRKIYFLEKHTHENYHDCTRGGNTASLKSKKDASMQISYLSQCFYFEGQDAKQYDDTVGEDVGTENSRNFAELQASAYEKAATARDSCEPDAWEYLMEAADLGHSTACRNVGEAFLYGTYGAQDHCSEAKPVKQNLTLAQQFLENAVGHGVYSAGKSLALLLEVCDECGVTGDEHLASLTTGLVHLAAASGEKDAFAILGRRYRQGIVASNSAVDIAAYHYYQAAVEAAEEFHQLGKQPLHEMTRLYDSLERDITLGERGDDDELIQFQKMNADKDGDVEAMAAMGDLYYWGAHGVPRDHAQAYQYFDRAARAGNVNSQSAVAGMLLKGEGTAQDNVTAIKWYEQAAEKNHTRALNGLGFIHFHGSAGIPENKSLALEYFERAAANQEDGDSIFNAGYCHASGLGTKVNFSRAMDFYDAAARKFGHFDAIFEMGKILMVGVPGVVSRDTVKALAYVKAASDGGQWGRTMRQGFNLYSSGDFERAVVYYHEARELGYPVATSNLAFLYDQRLLQPGDVASERRALKYLSLAKDENGDRETFVRIGDFHYYGLAELRKDPKTAIRWYSRASAEGVAVGAYNVGHMYEFSDGVEGNLERARRYYKRVLELSMGALEIELAIRFALARLTLRMWLQNTPLEIFLGWSSPLATATDTNTSTADSAVIFDAATNFFDGNLYVLISTTAIILLSIGAWYFHST